ncbi:MAG: hypothetical protein KJ607_04540 [Bacteroidetes bacterium]|nr:hypothetical protein [Bacteroidota bacterium]
MYYFEILSEFYHSEIRYLIVGGLAMNLHGVPRVTQDIDIIIATDSMNIHKTTSVLKSLDYVPRIPGLNPDHLADESKRRAWIEEKNMIAFSFYKKSGSYEVVDIIIMHPLDFEEAYKNRTIKKAKGIEFALAGINDLIKMKQISARSQDISDVQILKKLSNILNENDAKG